MNKCIAKPRASRKDNGPVVGEISLVFHCHIQPVKYHRCNCRPPLPPLPSPANLPPLRKCPRPGFQTSSFHWSRGLQPAAAAGSIRWNHEAAVERQPLKLLTLELNGFFFIVIVVCLFFLRRDNKSGGRGDVFRLRPDARSHERSPTVHQRDLQG